MHLEVGRVGRFCCWQGRQSLTLPLKVIRTSNSCNWYIVHQHQGLWQSPTPPSQQAIDTYEVGRRIVQIAIGCGRLRLDIFMQMKHCVMHKQSQAAAALCVHVPPGLERRLFLRASYFQTYSYSLLIPCDVFCCSACEGKQEAQPCLCGDLTCHVKFRWLRVFQGFLRLTDPRQRLGS